MIRLATVDDTDAILDIYAPIVRGTAISFEGEVPALSEMRRHAYASRIRTRAAYDWTAEVSVHVRDSAHRRGVGRALYTHLLRLLELQGVRGA